MPGDAYVNFPGICLAFSTSWKRFETPRFSRVSSTKFPVVKTPTGAKLLGSYRKFDECRGRNQVKGAKLRLDRRKGAPLKQPALQASLLIDYLMGFQYTAPAFQPAVNV
jgi:hypothetical protein